MAVLITGRMPLAATLVISIAVGMPINESSGMVTFGFSPRVISRICREKSMASSTVPPTSATIAGAVAIANPPMP
ncbi:hypothetical protein D3C72_1905490 [compost metagenome]